MENCLKSAKCMQFKIIFTSFAIIDLPYCLTLGDRLIRRLANHWQAWITINIQMCTGSKTKIKTQLTFKTLRLIITLFRLRDNGYFTLLKSIWLLYFTKIDWRLFYWFEEVCIPSFGQILDITAPPNQAWP